MGLLAEPLAHTVVTLAFLAVYLVLTLHGDDATAVLAALGGYIGGAGVQKVAQGASSGARG
jgi:hypothetical protein